MAKVFLVDTGGTLTNQLVSYYKLNESSGNAADSIGSNTLTNVNTVTYAAGKINNGAVFTASSSQQFTCADTGLGFTGNFSMSFWVKFTTLTGDYDFGTVAKSESAVGTGYKQVFYHTGSTHFIYLLVFDSSHVSHAGQVSWAPSTGTLYHIVAMWDTGGNMKFYVNGSQQGATQTGLGTSISASSDNFRLGFANGESYLDGLLDEVGLYSRNLTTQEITDLYNGGTGDALTSTSSSVSSSPSASASHSPSTSPSTSPSSSPSSSPSPSSSISSSPSNSSSSSVSSSPSHSASSSPSNSASSSASSSSPSHSPSSSPSPSSSVSSSASSSISSSPSLSPSSSPSSSSSSSISSSPSSSPSVSISSSISSSVSASPSGSPSASLSNSPSASPSIAPQRHTDQRNKSLALRSNSRSQDQDSRNTVCHLLLRRNLSLNLFSPHNHDHS